MEDEILEKIRGFTNLNAERKLAHQPEKNKSQGKNIETVAEFQAFFGLLLFIEKYLDCRIEDIWSTERDTFMLSFPGLTKVMGRKRFMQISHYRHFCDEDRARDMNQTNDKLYKLKPLLMHLRRTFMKNYIPERETAIDECMIPFKGRLGMKQYMKDKPIKLGIKVWMLAESKTGYNFNFEVYLGRNAIGIPHVGLGENVVLTLTEPLTHKGYHIYIDRFYTSPTLLYHMLQRYIYLCGTVQTNRIGFPREMVRDKAQANRMERGDLEWRVEQESGLVATAWKDNRIVYYLSSIHSPEEAGLTVIRRNKQGDALDIRATPSVADYNKYMGGVDLNDKMTKIDKSRKTYHWYNHISRKSLMWAVFNAYIIEGHFVAHHPPGKRARDFDSFFLEVIHQLVGSFTSRKRKQTLGHGDPD